MPLEVYHNHDIALFTVGMYLLDPFLIKMFLQSFGEELLCNDPCLGESVHAFLDFAVYFSVWGCYGAQFVMLNDIVRYVRKLKSHAFIPDHRGIQIEIFLSIAKNLKPGVDMTLLMRSLTVSRSAVGVPVSNG